MSCVLHPPIMTLGITTTFAPLLLVCSSIFVINCEPATLFLRKPFKHNHPDRELSLGLIDTECRDVFCFF